MKNSICFLFTTFFLFENCKGKEASNSNSKRDTTITAKNAFSELLLDSAKLEKFITDQELKDSAAERMRNFYNSRNYHLHGLHKMGLPNRQEVSGTFTTTTLIIPTIAP